MPNDPERPRGDSLATVGRGSVMGLADVVPGVSGGTMALLLGIYPRFISALASLDHRIVTSLGRGWSSFQSHAAAIDLWFLVRLVIGIGVGIIIGAVTIGGLIESHPEAMMAFFFGLILVSARIPWNRIEQRSSVLLLPLVAGISVAAAVAFLPVTERDVSAALLFAAGILAISAMLLPGISGSALLVVIGVYPIVLDAVRSVDLVAIAIFGAGALAGILLSSRLIRYALRTRHDGTMAVLTGLMLGSLVRVWPWRDAAGFGTGSPAAPDSALPVLLVLLGGALSLGLERAARGSTTPVPAPVGREETE